MYDTNEYMLGKCLYRNTEIALKFQCTVEINKLDLHTEVHGKSFVQFEFNSSTFSNCKHLRPHKTLNPIKISNTLSLRSFDNLDVACTITMEILFQLLVTALRNQVIIHNIA